MLAPQKSPEKSNGLWSKLKKHMNIKDTPEMVVEKRNPLNPRHMNGDSLRRNRSHGDFVATPGYDTNGLYKFQVGKSGRNSLKNVQLELANYDHENNILNSKPMPKKIVSPTHPHEFKRTLPVDYRLTNGDLKQHKELRRAATMSTITYERKIRNGSVKSASSHGSASDRQSLSPAGPSRASPEAAMPPRLGGKALWGKVQQHYTPKTLQLRDEPPVPKLATFAKLWEVIFQTVRENDMLELDEPDPKLWWRKVFVNLRRRHGKGG